MWMIFLNDNSNFFQIGHSKVTITYDTVTYDKKLEKSEVSMYSHPKAAELNALEQLKNYARK